MWCFMQDVLENTLIQVTTLSSALSKKYLKLQEYREDFLEWVKLGLPWKIHILCVHLPEWLDDHTEGLSKYAEQTCEATNKDFSATYNRFKRKESDQNHGRNLRQSVVEYSSRRIWNRVTDPDQLDLPDSIINEWVKSCLVWIVISKFRWIESTTH